MAVKIKTYKVAKSGKRGNHLTLPKTWLEDLALEPGDVVTVYRDELDRLILCGPGTTPNTDHSAGQAQGLKDFMEAAK